jgi:DNA-binding GntR family transcriptional regulator
MRDDVFEILRSAILNGTFAPGSRLRIQDLSARLEVSPTPVREALRRLEASGLVHSDPHRGARVTRLEAREIDELYEVRLLLEPAAARRAAAALPNRAREAIDARLRALSEAVENGVLAAALDADEELLAEIYSSAENAELLRQIKELWHRVRPYKLLHGVTAYGGRLPLYDWARDLVDACARGDGERAAAIIREQLESAQVELVRFGLEVNQRQARDGDLPAPPDSGEAAA